MTKLDEGLSPRESELIGELTLMQRAYWGTQAILNGGNPDPAWMHDPLWTQVRSAIRRSATLQSKLEKLKTAAAAAATSGAQHMCRSEAPCPKERDLYRCPRCCLGDLLLTIDEP